MPKKNIEEVEDAYAMREVVDARIKEQFNGVPFPLHKSSDMDTENHWTAIQDIDLADGGSFISDPDLDPNHLPGILALFASLVTFQSKKRTDWVKEHAVYDTMPELFISFAEKSRVDSGYRLLGRTIRHAFDSRITSMDICKAKLIIETGGEIGIQLLSEIPVWIPRRASNCLCSHYGQAVFAICPPV